MRSALQRAVDILGEDADAEELTVLACIVADMMLGRFLADRHALPEWRDGTGRDRIRIALTVLPDFVLIDFTEPRHVLVRLGFLPPS